MTRTVLPFALQPLDAFGEKVCSDFVESLVLLEEPKLLDRDQPAAVRKLTAPRSCEYEAIEQAVDALSGAVQELRLLKVPPPFQIAGRTEGSSQSFVEMMVVLACDLTRLDSQQRLIALLERLNRPPTPLFGGRENEALSLCLLLKAISFVPGQAQPDLCLGTIQEKLRESGLRTRAYLLGYRGNLGPVARTEDEISEAVVLFLEALFLSENWKGSLGDKDILPAAEAMSTEAPGAAMSVHCITFPVKEAAEYLSWQGLSLVLEESMGESQNLAQVPELDLPKNSKQSRDSGCSCEPFKFSVVSPIVTQRGLRRRLREAIAEFADDYKGYVDCLHIKLKDRRRELMSQVPEKVESNTQAVREIEKSILLDTKESAFLTRMAKFYEQACKIAAISDTRPSPDWSHIDRTPADELLAPTYQKLDSLIDAYPNALALVLYLGFLIAFLPRLLQDPLQLIVGAERAATWTVIIMIAFVLVLVFVYWVPSYAALVRATRQGGFVWKEHDDLVNAREGQWKANVEALEEHWQLKARRWIAWRLQERKESLNSTIAAIQATKTRVDDQAASWDRELETKYANLRFTVLPAKPGEIKALLTPVRLTGNALSKLVRGSATNDFVNAWEGGAIPFADYVRERIASNYHSALREHDFIQQVGDENLKKLVKEELYPLDWMIPCDEQRITISHRYISFHDNQQAVIPAIVAQNPSEREGKPIDCLNRIYLWRIAHNLDISLIQV